VSDPRRRVGPKIGPVSFNLRVCRLSRKRCRPGFAPHGRPRRRGRFFPTPFLYYLFYLYNFALSASLPFSRTPRLLFRTVAYSYMSSPGGKLLSTIDCFFSPPPGLACSDVLCHFDEPPFHSHEFSSCHLLHPEIDSSPPPLRSFCSLV